MQVSDPGQSESCPTSHNITLFKTHIGFCYFENCRMHLFCMILALPLSRILLTSSVPGNSRGP